MLLVMTAFFPSPLSRNEISFDARDDPHIRELVERMQKYHDDVEKEFIGQKVSARGATR